MVIDVSPVKIWKVVGGFSPVVSMLGVSAGVLVSVRSRLYWRFCFFVILFS